MTNFKVGDRVRDLNFARRGAGTVTGIRPNRTVGVRFDSWDEYKNETDAHSRVPTDLALVETALARQAREYRKAVEGDDEPSKGSHELFDLEDIADELEEAGLLEDDSTPFRKQVRNVLQSIEGTLVEKNESYGDSALNPVRIFSSASTEEQIRVRIDDKLSRLARGSDFEDEDTVTDLIGYLVLLKIAKNRENA